MSLATLETFDAYISAYGKFLGRKATETLRPLYFPGDDEEHDLSVYLRQPYPAQANVVNGAIHGWMNKKSLLICGEMGTGKTLIAMQAIDAHARASGKMVERNISNSINLYAPVPCYRALVMAPNHLIRKWKREIEKTIPHARVVTFERSKKGKSDDSYKAVLRYIDSCKGTRYSYEPKPKRATWSIPAGPEFVIIGRNQSKHDGGWAPIGHEEGRLAGAGVIRKVATGERMVVADEQGRAVIRDGQKVTRAVIVDAVVCPACGQPHADAKGAPVDPSVLWQKSAGQRTCRTRFLQEVHTADRKGDGLDRICPAPSTYRDDPEGKQIDHEGKTYRVRVCGERLWQYTPTPRKFPPARIIQKKAHGLFDYFLLDEMHEEKSATSAQAIAASKMMTASRRLMGLTGTLIGGYAEHLFPLLMRMSPGSLVAAGFTWGESMKFSRVYGKIETTYTTKYEKKSRSSSRKRNTNSLRKDDEDTTKTEAVKPGIMPSFYGHHLIGQTLFIGLAEMDADLPPIIDDDRSLVPVAMDDVLAESYQDVAKKLVEAVQDLLRKGNKRLLGAFLRTLLDYPDHPYGWDMIGYTDELGGYIPVVQPPDLPADVVRNKERALIDLVKKEVAEGRQCWVYAMMTDTRDVQPRLADLMKDEGLEVKILRSGTVDPTDREEWIADNAPYCDVIISHPELVSTGLDFFDRDPMTYNFATIIFYEGDYQVNRVRQAGRRHWRIGQPEECRTFYLYYEQTMQHRQVKHVGDKFAAAKQLEGSFSAEGLAALSGEDTGQMALAKSLSEKIDDIRGNWAKLRDETKAKILRAAPLVRSLRMAAAGDPETRIAARELARLAMTLDDLDLDVSFDDDDLDLDFDDLDDEPAPVAAKPKKAKKAKPAKKVAAKPRAKKPELAAVFDDLADLDLDLDFGDL